MTTSIFHEELHVNYLTRSCFCAHSHDNHADWGAVKNVVAHTKNAIYEKGYPYIYYAHPQEDSSSSLNHNDVSEIIMTTFFYFHSLKEGTMGTRSIFQEYLYHLHLFNYGTVFSSN